MGISLLTDKRPSKTNPGIYSARLWAYQTDEGTEERLIGFNSRKVAFLLKMHASYPWNLWRTKRFVLYAWNFWNPKLHTVWISLLQSSHKNNHELPVFSINLGSELKLRLRWNQIINRNPTKCTNIQRISNSARELLLLKCLPFCN